MWYRAISVALLSVCACGCGTLLNVAPESPIDPGHTLRAAHHRAVYGGVQNSMLLGGEQLDELTTLPFGICFLAIDVPISAVGDTVTLPITIPATWERHSRIEQSQSNQP